MKKPEICRFRHGVCHCEMEINWSSKFNRNYARLHNKAFRLILQFHVSSPECMQYRWANIRIYQFIRISLLPTYSSGVCVCVYERGTLISHPTEITIQSFLWPYQLCTRRAVDTFSKLGNRQHCTVVSSMCFLAGEIEAANHILVSPSKSKYE